MLLIIVLDHVRSKKTYFITVYNYSRLHDYLKCLCVIILWLLKNTISLQTCCLMNDNGSSNCAKTNFATQNVQTCAISNHVNVSPANCVNKPNAARAYQYMATVISETYYCIEREIIANNSYHIYSINIDY